MYFLLERHSVREISQKAQSIFGDLFSHKMFLQQLAFHKDIDYREAVDFLIPNPPGEEAIKSKLIQEATNIFD